MSEVCKWREPAPHKDHPRDWRPGRLVGFVGHGHGVTAVIADVNGELQLCDTFDVRVTPVGSWSMR